VTLKQEILAMHGPVTLPGLMKQFRQVLYNTHVVPIAPVIEPIRKSTRKESKKRKKLGRGRVPKRDPIYAEVVDDEIAKAQKAKQAATSKVIGKRKQPVRSSRVGMKTAKKARVDKESTDESSNSSVDSSDASDDEAGPSSASDAGDALPAMASEEDMVMIPTVPGGLDNSLVGLLSHLE
jgi:hypothetical protein